jgi:siroheme synthase
LWTGTLGNIVSETSDRTLSPCIIVVGEVVKLREYL